MRFHLGRLASVGLALVVLAGVSVAAGPTPPAARGKPDTVASVLPRLVDLGAGKCIPCKKMAPILEELQKEYAGIVDVVFIDVWKDAKAGKPYKIRLIPTQVFFDRSGKEVFRHEGFFSKEEIEQVFREKMGVATPPAAEDEKDEDSTERAPGSDDPTGLGIPGEDHLHLGVAPDRPPLSIEIVLATSITCQCVKERSVRYLELLHRVLDPYGERVVQRWTDRADDPARADSLLAAWGLEELPGIALLDREGRPYWGDDEEIDVLDLRAQIEERM
jgi:thioredoxin 1